MPEAKQDLGLSVLTSSAVFGAWSAWNSSLFTAATFVDSEEKYKNAKLAMDLGLLTAIATGAGVYLVYGEKGKIAAVSAIATGAVLYIAYYCKLQSNPIVAAFMNKNKTQKSSSLKWAPMSDEEINNIRNYINNQSVQVVSEP